MGGHDKTNKTLKGNIVTYIIYGFAIFGAIWFLILCAVVPWGIREMYRNPYHQHEQRDRENI